MNHRTGLPLILVVLAACAGNVTESPGAAQGVAVDVQPRSTQVVAGGTVRFASAVTGSSVTAVAWTVVEAAGGTIDATGLYTATSVTGQYHVKATSQADASKSAVATVTVTPPFSPVAVSVTPHTAALSPGQSVSFSASVTGSSDTAVVWTVQEASGCGSVTQAGVYTAPGTAGVCHVVATSRADGTRSDSATVTVGQVVSGSKNIIGVNMSTALYYDPGKMYADGMKQAIIMNSTGNVDSNGWPLVPSFSVRSGHRPYNEGRWVIYWDGTATVASVSGTWDRQVHGPSGTGPDGLSLGPNTRYINVDVAAGVGVVAIDFTNAARNDGTGWAGLTNIKMMRPMSQGATSAHRRDQTASRVMINEAAKGFSVYRYMDFLGTNRSQIRTWGGYPWQPSRAYSVGQRVTMCRGAYQSDPCGRVFEATTAGTSNSNPAGGPDASVIGSAVNDGTVVWKYVGYGRPLPTWSGFSRSETDGFAFAGTGGPFEDVIRFSNETGVDPWICVPVMVDDDYLTKLALLFKWGSDGAMPYTGPYGSGGSNPQPQSGPIYPPLNSNRNIYLEYSNELWNTSFSQTTWLQANAVADGVLDFNGDATALPFKFVGRQTVKISNAFRAAFGDGDMPYTGSGRIRPSIHGQMGVPAQTHGGALRFVHDYFGDGDGKDHSANRRAHGFDATPHPITYYIWGAGVAPYWHSSGTTVADHLNSMSVASGLWTVHNETPARYVKSFGLKLMTYEGGPELPSVLGAQINMTDRPATPNMRDTVIDNFNDWIRTGGDMAVYYIHAWYDNTYNWTFVHDDGDGGNPWNLDSPKMNAVQEIANSPPVAITLDSTGLSIGTAIPGTAPGGKYAVWWSNGLWVPEPPRTGSKSLNGSDAWQNEAGYVFLASNAANRTVTASVSGGGTVAAFVDGVRLGTNQTANGTVTFGSVPLGPGLHGVILVAVSGGVTVNSVTVN